MANSKKQQQEIDFTINRLINLDDHKTRHSNNDDDDNDDLHDFTNLEKEAAILLANIQIQEDYLNYRKQNGKLDLDDKINMQTLIVEFLNCLSLIDAYSLLKDQPLPDIDSFIYVVDKCFSARLKQFVFYFFTQ